MFDNYGFGDDGLFDCVICGATGRWQCTEALLNDPSIEIEHMCPTCIKAVTDAEEQGKSSHKRK